MADLEGSIEYWDKNGKLHNPQLRPLPKVKQFQNSLKAFGTNAHNWIEEENFDSPAYQQKLGTILGLESLVLGGIFPEARPVFNLIKTSLFPKRPLKNVNDGVKRTFYNREQADQYYNDLLENNRYAIEKK